MLLKKEVAMCFFMLLTQFGLAQNYPQDYFKPPLEIPLYLSGTFGELRSGHFHSGLDIKTQEREGQRVLAAADGTVARIKVSPYGFGNAIYIRHPNGYTTVYAHLQRFNDTIQDYVRQQQYRQQSFAVDLFPPAGKFQVKQGELIALSGSSGSSGGPHLHFEIRDTRTEKIINPLLFGLPVKDTRSPDLYSLEVYGFQGDNLVSSYSKDLLKVSDGNYSLAGDNLVEVNNKPGFGVIAFDRLDGASNRDGVYAMDLWIGDKKYFDLAFNTFAFSETRYVNSHIDYAQKYCCNQTINKLYIDPNNRFSEYKIGDKMNLPDLKPDSIYPVKIDVSDEAGNTSVLQFNLVYHPGEVIPNEDVPEPSTVFHYDKANTFKNDNVKMYLPDGALYTDVYFEYQKKNPCDECLSYIHSLASPEIPVHSYYTLKIKPDEEFKGDKSKLAIASFKDGKIDDYEGGKWENGFVVAKTRQFGEFAVVVDTVPPTIRPVNFRDGSDVKDQNRLDVIIDDDFSGIDDYTPTIDGKWVLFNYDAKNDLIYADLKDLGVEPGEHVLKLTVKDGVGNSNEKSFTLTF